MPDAPSFFSKFADNAHLGKIGTDFAPGIILTVCVLLLVNNFTDMKVFPYAKLETYKELKDDSKKKWHDARQEVKKAENKIYGLEATLEGEQDAAKEKELKTKLALARKVLPGLIEDRDERKAEATERANETRDAMTLSSNIDILGKHFTTLFIMGYFVGIILAQVSGRIFYNGLYYAFFKKKYPDVFAALYDDTRRSITYLRGKVKDPEFLKGLPDLETTYYRYLEVAMNMVLPCGALAVTLLVVGFAVNGKLAIVLGVVMIPVTWAIYLNGRVQYVGYSFKKADVVALVKEKIAAGG